MLRSFNSSSCPRDHPRISGFRKVGKYYSRTHLTAAGGIGFHLPAEQVRVKDAFLLVLLLTQNPSSHMYVKLSPSWKPDTQK